MGHQDVLLIDVFLALTIDCDYETGGSVAKNVGVQARDVTFHSLTPLTHSTLLTRPLTPLTHLLTHSLTPLTPLTHSTPLTPLAPGVQARDVTFRNISGTVVSDGRGGGNGARGDPSMRVDTAGASTSTLFETISSRIFKLNPAPDTHRGLYFHLVPMLIGC